MGWIVTQECVAETQGVQWKSLDIDVDFRADEVHSVLSCADSCPNVD